MPIVRIFLKIKNNHSSMFSPRIFRIAKIELTKYVNIFNIVIISFVYLQAVLYSWLELKKVTTPISTDIGLFQSINYHFTSLIFSAAPLTIILTISREFSTGYALKLISNGVSRLFYFQSKYLLAAILTVILTLLYILIIPLLLLLIHVNFPDKILLLKSVSYTLFLSLFITIIIVSITLLVRNWQYSLLIYYGFSFAENFIVYQFGENTLWANYLPFHLGASIFQFQKDLKTFSDYTLAGCTLVFVCFVIVTVSYHFFKKVDL